MSFFKTHKKKSITVISILVILLIIRLALPHVILHYTNDSLHKLRGYNGKIDDIDLKLIRGAYTIKKMFLNKRDTVTGLETEFFKVRQVDLALLWSALFKGKLAGEILLENPTIYFIKEKAEPKDVARDSSDFRQMIKDLMPIDLNRLEVKNGEVRYLDPASKPAVDIFLSDLEVMAENLSNAENQSVMPATVTASFRIYGGTFNFNMTFDPLAEQPTYDMNAELRNTDLTQMNSFFKAYGNFDVNKGTFGLYTESAGKDGKFIGYVKPVIRDLDILGPEDKDQSLLKKFWEGALGGIGFIFRNQPKEQVATKIPIEGSFGKAKVNIIYAIADVLYNAFIEALRPAIDKQINLSKVDKSVSGDKGIIEKMQENKERAEERRESEENKESTSEKKTLKERFKERREKRKENKAAGEDGQQK